MDIEHAIENRTKTVPYDHPARVAARAKARAEGKRVASDTPETRSAQRTALRIETRAPARKSATERVYTAATKLEIREAVAEGIGRILERPRSETQEAAYRTAFDAYIRRAVVSTVLERRDMTEATGSAGGCTVPSHLQAELLKDLKAQSGIISNARVISTPDFGGPLVFPILKDATHDSGSVGDGTLIGMTDVVMGAVSFPICPVYVSADLARIAVGLAQDITSFDIEDVLREAWALRVARALEVDAVATLAAGCTPLANSTASATPLWADLVAAFFSVDAAYRASAAWYFDTNTVKAIRKMVDTTNARPLFIDTPTLVQTDANGQQQRTMLLMGAPVYETAAITNDIASSGSAVYGFFGSMKHALPMRVGAAEVQVVRERFADYGQLGYIGRARFDVSQIGLASAVTALANHA
jgi:HK97 family phage major capsid protein